MFKSIRSKFISIAVLSLVILTFVGTGYYIHLTSVLDELEQERSEVYEKALIVEDLESSYNDMLFRARGYYAFLDENEKNQLENRLEDFKNHLSEFEQVADSEQETLLYNDLVVFIERYENELLPAAITLVENENYLGLRDLASGGANETINQFLDFTRANEVQSNQRLDDIYTESVDTANLFTLITLLASAGAIIILFVIIFYLLRDLLRPIDDLKLAANSLAAGKEVYHDLDERKDEIGALNQSFYHMAQAIQEKEEELMSQNEELQAQQDELSDHQDQMRYYITDIENMKRAMDQFSLVTTIDENGVFTYVNEKFVETTDYKQEETIGKTYKMMLVSENDRDFFKNIKQQIQSGSIWNGEGRFSTGSGGVIWLQMTVVPYVNKYGRPYQYIAIGLDITESKQMQNKLKESLSQTEKTKTKLERYNQLNHAMSLDVGKENFVSTVFSYINKLYNFDKSVLMLVDEPVYRAMGLTQKTIDQFINTDHSELVERLKSEKHLTVKRKATQAEQGLAEEAIEVYDYYTGVRNANGEVMAVLAATTVGMPVCENDLLELDGIMNRVSIALERVLIYDEIEESRKLNQDIINNVNEGIQFVSETGDMIQINEMMCELSGCQEWLKKKPAAKNKWMIAFTKAVENREETATFFDKCITENYRGALNHQYILYKNGQEKVIDVYGTSVFNDDSERVGTIFVHRDITREHELDQMKSELVSTVSHELRTPLSSVLGFTELLLKKDLKPERQRKYLDTIYKEAKRLTNLINNFLDLQRMESGNQKYDMAVCSLDTIVMDVMNNFKHVNSHQLSFVDESKYVKVKADQERLEQVLTNLISNAIKFSPDGGSIKVRLQNEENQMVIRIEDPGLGIPKDAVDKLFSKFHRIDQTDRKKIGGTGLGLAIAKEIIDQHDGSIWVESEEGKGSIFSVSLPLLDGMMNEETMQSSSATFSPSSVMIIEDDTSLALLLSEELKANGFRVIHHYDPQNAYDDIVRTELTAVVVDLMLGEEMDGWELIEKLKLDPKTKDLPIVISSALDRSDEKVQQFQVNEYLTKPYPPNELSKTLLQFVQSQEKQAGEVLFPRE
ncbi:ATP-binding protein [Salipaludibacillus daqingensis]|uniref:ATP-binding protein n=1 Tax=Salipaludibacillus daqingensis TaxID=3041001 RepID=UPI0024732D40|nr:ATP-binding protein [Salipaludibacillus daqingensis]